jgi:phosphohistidine phosphatase
VASPCELYLVRHAIAAQRGEDWPDDDKRPLTERGISRFTEAVTGLKSLDVELDEIFTSPLVRAKQTAQYLSSGLPSKPPVSVVDALAPGHVPAEMMEQVAREARGHTRVAIVGHEPDLGELIGWLVGAKRAIPMKKGGVCRLDLETLSARHGTLVWHLPPKALRKLGR